MLKLFKAQFAQVTSGAGDKSARPAYKNQMRKVFKNGKSPQRKVKCSGSMMSFWKFILVQDAQNLKY
jgi:hypothetical protein